MPRTVCIKPYGGGNPKFDKVIKQRPRLEMQLEFLLLAVKHVAGEGTRNATVYGLISSLILTWPWSLAHIDDVARLIEEAGLPNWALRVAHQVVSDIKSGELVNSWVNPFTQPTPPAD